MNKEIATKVFESLASGIRLDVWRLLVKAGLEGQVAGQLASELDIAPNTLSFHLKAMLHAGLLSVEQEGRFLRYRANIPLMLDLIGYLTEECCAGHPEACGLAEIHPQGTNAQPRSPCCDESC
ncbi:ArsR/SmtB family transcription factor [Aeromonas bivalvium]|uniref:ArsR/SmtB family transcription factor n=1 Tax=Aeromonas bivalvium TaxID=440079 RepID=UPI000DCFB2CC|nr:helix-turn-helix domain-containing protein [Aeromonas bivalvium]